MKIVTGYIHVIEVAPVLGPLLGDRMHVGAARVTCARGHVHTVQTDPSPLPEQARAELAVLVGAHGYQLETN